MIPAPHTPLFFQDEVEVLQQVKKGGTIHNMEDELAAKTQEVAELNQQLEEIRAAFGSEGVQQVSCFVFSHLPVHSEKDSSPTDFILKTSTWLN